MTVAVWPPEAGAGGPPSGPAGGDLGGTYPMPTVVKVPESALWALGTNVRYFAVDYDAGNDANVGFVDAAAGAVFTTELSTVAVKTLEQLRNILPRVGNGRKCVVLIKPRSGGAAYLNQAAAADYLDIGYDGYAYIALRGSDLTNSVNDKVDLGGIVGAAGPNGDSSWTVASQSSFSITNSAGSLPAENDVAGLKVQFKGNVTAAARTEGRTVTARSSATVLDTGQAQTLAAGDEYFLMLPGVQVTKIVGQPGHNGGVDTTTNTTQGLQILGLRCSATVNTQWQGAVLMQFVRFDGTGTLSASAPYNVGTSYRDETDTVRNTRCGIDFRLAGSIKGECEALYYSAAHSTFQAQGIAWRGVQKLIGAGSYFNSLVTLATIFSGGNDTTSTGGGTVFGSDSTTQRRSKIKAGLACRGNNDVSIGRVDQEAATAGIEFRENGGRFGLFDITGALASGVNAISCAGTNANVQIGTGVAPTVSGGGVEIALQESRTATFASLTAQYAAAQDGSGNIVQGSGGRIPSPYVETQFYADQLDVPDNGDWTVNAIATTSTKGGTDDDIKVALFDRTTEEGRGFPLYIPLGATRIKFEYWICAQALPVAPDDQVRLKFYRKEYQDNTAPTAWSSAVNLTERSLAANVNLQRFVDEGILSTYSLVAGRGYNIEITRDTGLANELPGDLGLWLLRVTVS